MKKIEFAEPVEGMDGTTIELRLKSEAPLLADGIRRNGFLRGAYFPRSVARVPHDLARTLGESPEFICVPPNLGDERSWGTLNGLLTDETFAYLEKGCESERFLKSRGHPRYNIRHGLPLVDGKPLEPSDRFAIWIDGHDDPDSWILNREKTLGGKAESKIPLQKNVATAALGFLIAAAILALFLAHLL